MNKPHENEMKFAITNTIQHPTTVAKMCNVAKSTNGSELMKNSCVGESSEFMKK